MKKYIVFIVVLLTSLVLTNRVYSQTENESFANYNFEKIMAQQTYDIDMQEYRKAETIINVLIKEFRFIKLQSNPEKAEGIENSIKNIRTALNSAKIINMNYSMFTKDIEYVKELTKKIDLNYEKK